MATTQKGGCGLSILHESPIDRDISLDLAVPEKILSHPVRDEPAPGRAVTVELERGTQSPTDSVRRVVLEHDTPALAGLRVEELHAIRKTSRLGTMGTVPYLRLYI